MASKKTTSNDILVKVDQNNLIYIDPNTVVSDGIMQRRQVEPENMVIYVNLEADLIPRTTLISGNQTNTLISIAQGTLNFLQNKNGRDYDTTWTDAFTNIKERKVTDINTLPADFIGPPQAPTERGTGEFRYEGSSQTFGISDINIKIAGTNFVPQISIKFIDVRGKTLFESPENSPYKAFFHLPWPIFYLTVKGYYGKAIKYRLHMVSFNSAYNSSTGNFDIDTVFVGSTYAFLNDIPLAGILNAPYMYGIEKGSESKFNEKTGYYEKTLSKTSVGYITLKSVYDEYKSKGLLPKNFPVRTLREIAVIARRLNKILENEIFREIVDPKILAGVKEFEELIQALYTSVDVWKQKHLSGRIYTLGDKKLFYLSDLEKNSYTNVTGKTSGTLEEILTNYTVQLEGNQAFGKNRDEKLIKKEGLQLKKLSLDGLQTISDFYRAYDSNILIDYTELVSRIDNIRRDFIEQRNKLEETLQNKMNEIVKKPDTGFGFEPTIRNIIGVVLANADTYIRLLKDVHVKAFKASETRKSKLQGVPTDSVGDDNIYPWPEVKENSVGTKQNILVYPGSTYMTKKLGSDDRVMWPEVGFVEEYNSVSTYKVDPLTEKEGTSDIVSYVFESNTDELNSYDLTTLTYLTDIVPYYNKTMSSILYEIWERARYITALESFDSNTVQEQAKLEFENIKNQIKEDYEIIEILKQQVPDALALQELMYGYSPYERWPYYESQLSTVPYISNTLSSDFSVNKFDRTSQTVSYGNSYGNLINNLNNYIPEAYRSNIYPFNSTTYKLYLPTKTFGRQELDLHKILNLRTNDSFISSPIDASKWIKDAYTTNLFTHQFSISGITKHILNTPYFHKQLYDDFINGKISGKYASSAYLFLTSLPFKDLDETMSYNGKDVLISTIFREIGATHYIPYHLMLKWGAIYHRYKTYILDGVDIIEDVTEPIDTKLFFDNNLERTYDVGLLSVDRVSENNIGLYPYYQAIFHQIVHNYTFYDPTSITATTTYSEAVDAGNIIDFDKSLLGNLAWTSAIDNSKYDSTTTGYTILPSNGNYNFNNVGNYLISEQDNFRILWGVETNGNPITSYSGETFPPYNQYFKDIDNVYSLSSNNKMVIDLIATFKPDILDVFEQAFLTFASETLNEEISYSPYDVKYSTFQSMLKDIVYVTKSTTSPTSTELLLNEITTKQNQNLLNISNEILSNDNLIKLTLSNPKEIDTYSLFGFTGVDSKYFDGGEFFPSQINQQNLDYIELYLGEDMDSYYVNFFSTNNIALNEENIKSLRFLIYTYAGAWAGGINVSGQTEFITYLQDNIISKNPVSTVSGTLVESASGGMTQRISNFLKTLIPLFQSLVAEQPEQTLTMSRGYNDDPIKLELYNYFKSFNDKWVAGNSLGQRTLMEEFLFLDKANRDIGDEVFLSMDRLMTLLDQGDLNKTSLFSAINLLIKNTGFDIRPLPAYVNFYGTNFSNTAKIVPSKNVAKNLFGTFLEVDYQESSPKIILQYTGPTSKHLELSDIDRDAKFRNDSFDISNVNNNPLVIAPDVFRNVDYSKSNKAVAFEVSFGDQNQSIFKGLELNQNTIRNTSESFEVLERLGNQETGSSTAQIDIGLFDIYRTASYSCTVMAMGNVMIQPTMYFYLKNVPMFRGSYWITEVNHVIRNNSIETTFTGSRIPLQSLPDPKDSFLASYRALFDVITNKAVAKVQQEMLTPTGITQYEETILDEQNNKLFTVNRGETKISGEEIIKVSGVKEYGIPYNGYNGELYIQLVKYRTTTNSDWLRARVVEMGGVQNFINDASDMGIISRYVENNLQTKTTWGEIKNTTGTQSFYSTHFDIGVATSNKIIDEFSKTEFHNPQNGKTVVITSSVDNANKKYTGPINIGPKLDGISMSKKLMTDLGLYDGQVVYFRLTS